MSMHGRDRRHANRRFAAGGNDYEQCDPRDVAEIERLQQQIHELELNQHEWDDQSATESAVWDDDRDPHFQNIFGRQRQDAPRPHDPLRAFGISVFVRRFQNSTEGCNQMISWIGFKLWSGFLIFIIFLTQ